MLNDNHAPANGSFVLRVTLYGIVGGLETPVAGPLGPITNAAVNGAFTVSPDFPNTSDGSGQWRGIAVHPDLVNASFMALSPRGTVSAIPDTITAENISGNLEASQLNGAIRTVDGANGPTFVAGSDNNTVGAVVSGATIAGGGLVGPALFIRGPTPSPLSVSGKDVVCNPDGPKRLIQMNHWFVASS